MTRCLASILLVAIAGVASGEEDEGWRRVGHYIRPALRWAESDDRVEIFLKFAHKIDAPGVSVDAADVDARFSSRSAEVVARTSQKAFYDTLDLKREIASEACTYERKSSGVLLRLEKRTRGRWRTLTRARRPQTHVWYDRQSALDESDARRRKADRAWSRAYAHRCEACELAFEAALGSSHLRGAGEVSERSFRFDDACDRATARFPTKSDKLLSSDARRACHVIAANATFRANVLAAFQTLRLTAAAPRDVYDARSAACPAPTCPHRRRDDCLAFAAAADDALATRHAKRTRSGATRVVASLCDPESDDLLGPSRLSAICDDQASLVAALRRTSFSPRDFCTALAPDSAVPRELPREEL